jgi:hypothetical protein
LYLGYVLALFPWTRAYAHHLLRFVLGPLSTIGRAVVANIPNLIFLAILFFIVRFALRMTYLFFDAVRRGAVTLAWGCASGPRTAGRGWSSMPPRPSFSDCRSGWAGRCPAFVPWGWS